MLATILFFATSASRHRERVRRPRRGLAVVHRAVRQLRRGDGRRPRQGPGRHAAQDALRDRSRIVRRRRRLDRGRPERRRSQIGDDVRRRGRRGDPRRRRRRSRASRASTSRRSPASRRRSSASRAATARPSPAAPACSPTGSSCAITAEAGRDVPRPDDRPRRGRRAARRRRTRSRSTSCSPASRSSSCSPSSRCSRSPIYSDAEQSDHRARRAARLPDPDDDRRAALGHRHRRHGPARAAQRARHVRPRGRGGRRLLDAAARQDRHDHARQPPGGRVPPAARRRPRTSSPTPRSCRASPTRRRKAARSSCSPRSGTASASASSHGADARPVHRPDPHERRRPRRPLDPQGRGRLGAALGRGARRHRARRARRRSSSGSPASGGTPLVVAERRAGALGVDPPQGHRQGGHARALRRAAARWASAR